MEKNSMNQNQQGGYTGSKKEQVKPQDKDKFTDRSERSKSHIDEDSHGRDYDKTKADSREY